MSNLLPDIRAFAKLSVISRRSLGAAAGRALRLAALSAMLTCMLSPRLLPAAEKPHVPEIVHSSNFREYHPDVRFRLKGLYAHDRGSDELALKYFLKAARFADKESQAIVAEMLWTGRGSEMDRPLAYAWMDLAAERGYPLMVAVREHYWSEMTEAERHAAVNRGATVYAEYGDEVAKPRMENALRRMRREMTGSRVGALGSPLDVYVVGKSGMWVSVPDVLAYQPRYFRAADYWEWQDERLDRIPIGRVDVGELKASGDRSE